MIALPMHGWADVERIPDQTPAPGPNTIDPHSGCDKSLSPWPSSLWPSIRFTGKHMGTERPARHLRQGLLHSNLDTTHPFAPMISDLDIWRAASLLIQQHGAEAELAAARRADLMLERGDLEGQIVWKRIRRTIVELQAPPTGPAH